MRSRISPEVIEEWKALFKRYTTQEGMMPCEAYLKIGAEYGRSEAGVRYYIEPGRREYSVKKAKEHDAAHRENKLAYLRKYGLDERRNSALYKTLVNNMNMIFQSIFATDTELTEDELFSRVRNLSGLSDAILPLLPLERTKKDKYRFKKITL